MTTDKPNEKKKNVCDHMFGFQSDGYECHFFITKDFKENKDDSEMHTFWFKYCPGCGIKLKEGEVQDEEI